MNHLHISQRHRLTTPLGSISLFGIVAVILAGFVATSIFLQAISPAHAATLNVCPSGCAYNNIQAAVTAAAPHDTISIEAGIYTVTQILVSKPLTIIGAGEGQTIIDAGLTSGGYSQDGTIRIHTNRDGAVNLSGFTLRNFSRKNTTGNRYGIFVRSGATASFPTTQPVNLSNIEIQGTGVSDSATDYGIYFAGVASLPEPAASINHVEVSGTRGNGVLFEDWRNTITIQNSTLHEGPFGATSLFIGHGIPLDGPNLGKVTIDSNIFEGRGIAIAQTAPGRLNGGFSDIEITNNHISTINGTKNAISVQAPALAGVGQSIGRLHIEGNFIEGDGFSPTDVSHSTTGIRITGAMDMVSILDNELVGLAAAVRSASNASGSPTNVIMTQNRLAANDVGVENTSTAPISAPANWWGCSQDPHSSAPACAVVTESPGLVVIPTWVVRTAELPSPVRPGATYTIPVHLAMLSDGSAAHLSPSDNDIVSFTITVPADAPDGMMEVATDAIPLEMRTWFGESFTLNVEKAVEPPEPIEPVDKPAPEQQGAPIDSHDESAPLRAPGTRSVLPLAPNTGFQKQTTRQSIWSYFAR